jgi:WD40-like Beta Propeller Repeat
MVAEVSTVFIDRQPTISRNGLEMFFASNRPGSITAPNGQRTLDVWVATRATTKDAWSAPLNVGPPVNSSANEAGPALSFDGRTLYFQSV